METRICKRCGFEKELNKANFPSGTYGINKDKTSFEKMCKICKNEVGNLKYHGLYVEEVKPVETVRVCNGECGLEKELNKDNFYFSEEKFAKKCINCTAIDNKKYREENKDRIKARKHEIFNSREKVNVEDIEPFKKICSGPCGLEKDSTEFSFHIWHNDFVSQCRDCCNEAARIYAKEHPELKKEQSKNHYNAHKEELNKKSREYKIKPENKERAKKKEKEKYDNDPIYKLRKNVSSTINRYLAREGGSKNGSSIMKYLPYTMEELMGHLESQFEPWMTRKNRGIAKHDKKTWHTDHIVPQIDLPFPTMDHINFQRCWALANLRPLEAQKNIAKLNRISDELRAETLAKIDAELEERANKDPEFRITLDRLKIEEVNRLKKVG